MSSTLPAAPVSASHERAVESRESRRRMSQGQSQSQSLSLSLSLSLRQDCEAAAARSLCLVQTALRDGATMQLLGALGRSLAIRSQCSTAYAYSTSCDDT